MRILVVNKFGFVRGGLERGMFGDIEALRALGHEVELFATAHPENVPARFAASFPPYHEIGVGSAGGPAAVRDMFSNRDAATAIATVIEEFRPDVVHCHGIHRHLSPSVLDAAHAKGVPTVLSAHDFFLVCPANVLLRGGSEPCYPRRCGTRLYGGVLAHRCVQHSAARSALAGLELSFQRIRRSYERGIDRIVAPSAFLARVLAEGGFDPARISVVPNGVEPSAIATLPPADRSGFLYAGRLSPEKGVDHAIEAAIRAGVALGVAGGGPLAGALAARQEAHLLGHLDAPELSRRMSRARALILPSVGYENAPMTILEAMAVGTPVIASAIGGIPEQIEDGVHGLLVPPGDVDALAAAMRRLAADDDLVARLGAAARERAEREFSIGNHLEQLLAVYRDVGARS